MKKSVITASLLLVGLCCLVGVSGSNGGFIPRVLAAFPSAANTGTLSVGFNYTVTLSTTMGTIVIGLFDDMPITTSNFKNLTQLGYYDGTIFHRVVHNFVIQSGDLSGKGIVVPKILDELPNKHSNIRGSVAMAKTSLPNSATSQFYINLVDNTYLDANYSVFGEVIQGMDVVDSIGNVATVNDKPVQDVTVQIAVLQAIPEFASWIFPMLSVTAVLLIVIYFKKSYGRTTSFRSTDPT